MERFFRPAVSLVRRSGGGEDGLVVLPGEVIASHGVEGYIRGHGTYLKEGRLLSSVCGVVERVNKLVSARPLEARYVGSIGDVIVGRITEVGSTRWKVAVNARQDGVLMQSSVMRLGGEMRRRTHADQLDMRQMFAEGDLVSAEVQQMFGDGAISLHARSLKYGKLTNGLLVQVPCTLVKRLPQHFVSLQCGVDVIVGSNGNIWISPTRSAVVDGLDETAAFAAKAAASAIAPTAEERQRLSRVRNSVTLLRTLGSLIDPPIIMRVYAASMALGIGEHAMLDAGAIASIVEALRSES